ncbi:MAG: cobyric acid synthase [Selenomonas sp.]|uniref:cobyric acid synthase n=1 Tax=Selenomonas sp. TaxID=2053611 RepID=UPI0025CDB291|nr:cobyric acid synthase [Selenomonas sp.]MCR5756915.1 cobyric acid synthase [Selenomonas sp.]
MANSIMLMGTSSHVGKSIITTALCRIFHQEGRRVVPFKAQNMALNSYVTRDGKEMGRAQVAQAEAAGLEPMVDMNPVLLKPTGNSCSQVVLNGKAIGNMSAREYHKGYSLKAFDAVKEALNRLQNDFDTLVIEGAGSPAEVNLKANDIVNMRVAKYLQAPVLLIADIDRGGALASLVGTLELLDEDERALVKGLIINKFRGDVTLLTPAVEFLEQKTGKPVLGIVPHIEDMGIDDEDSVSLDDREERAAEQNQAALRIAVIQTPKISNFTDFDSLAAEPDVSLYYVRKAEELGTPDMIILPGSKNTTEDLLHLREYGLEKAIQQQVEQGIPLWGICGGYQMLGQKISDPLHTESAHNEVQGLGYLPMETTFAAEKLTSQVEADCVDLQFLGRKLQVRNLYGYEIHTGETKFTGSAAHPFCITKRSNQIVQVAEGLTCQPDGQGQVTGTYIHGVFDQDDFRRQLLNALRARKGLEALPIQRSVRQEKERAYNRLASVVRHSIDMEKLAQIMGEGTC